LVKSVKALKIIPLSIFDNLVSFNGSGSLDLILEYGPKDGMDKFKDRIVMIKAVADKGYKREREEREELKKRYQPHFNVSEQRASRLDETHVLDAEGEAAPVQSEGREFSQRDIILTQLNQELEAINKTASPSDQKYVELSCNLIQDIQNKRSREHSNIELINVVNHVLPQFQEAPHWYEKIADSLIKLANLSSGAGKQFSLFCPTQCKTVDDVRRALKLDPLGDSTSIPGGANQDQGPK